MDFFDNLFGIIASIIGILAAFTTAGIIFIRKNKTKIKGGGISNNNEGDSNSISQSPLSGNNSVMVFGNNNTIQTADKPQNRSESDVSSLKITSQILFIDDEEFNVIKMLEKAGWKNIRKMPDIVDFDCSDLRNANIVFVDIKGVGIELGFKNEGIGLAAEIKRRYPNKGVIIYSATPEHPLFDPDIDMVDGKLSKNAEPIEFQNMIEQYGTRKN